MCRCVCLCAGQSWVCPGRRVRYPVLQMSVAATSPVDPPRPPNSECSPHTAPSLSRSTIVSLPRVGERVESLALLTPSVVTIFVFFFFFFGGLSIDKLPPFPAVMNRSQALFWAGRISGGRCSSLRVLLATPAANRSKTPQSAPRPTRAPPLTAGPGPDPGAFPCARNSSCRLVS